MTMIDRQQRLLSPEQLAEWTPPYRRMYAQRLPKSWPRVRELLEMSELAYAPPPEHEVPDEAPEVAETRRPVNVIEIIYACAKCAMISVVELKSPRRAQTTVMARQAAMYLATKHTGRSLPEIGRRFGGKDHSTVHHARNKVREDLAAGGAVFGSIIAEVERELGVA